MVQTNLVFFDTNHNGLLGTKRGLISFFPLLLVLGLITTLMEKNIPIWNRIGGVCLLSLVLCSAIAVQLPYDYRSAIIYGGLVGFVVGISIFALSLSTSNYEPSKLEQWSAVLFPIIIAPLSALTFGLSTKWGWYP
tara:strand:- start:102 stop:509 length:408 start_codon:yes stop_codon:yes gene_type:complete